METSKEDYWAKLQDGTLTIKELQGFFLENDWIQDTPIMKKDSDGVMSKEYSSTNVLQNISGLKKGEEVEALDDLETNLFTGAPIEVVAENTKLDKELSSTDSPRGMESRISLDLFDSDIGLNLEGMTFDMDDFEKDNLEAAQVRAYASSAIDARAIPLREVMLWLVDKVMLRTVYTLQSSARLWSARANINMESLLYNNLHLVLYEFKLCQEMLELCFYWVYKQLYSYIRANSSFKVKLLRQEKIQGILNSFSAAGPPIRMQERDLDDSYMEL